MTMNDSEVDTELSRDDYASGGRGDEKEESAAAAAAKHDNHNREMERADYNDNYNPNDRNESATAGGAGAGAGGGAGGASSSGIKLRPVFLGNLDITYKSEDVADIFSRPMVPQGVDEGTYRPFAVDQIDVKKGYCFVYLKNVSSEGEKASVENFVRDICGMYVPSSLLFSTCICCVLSSLSSILSSSSGGGLGFGHTVPRTVPRTITTTSISIFNLHSYHHYQRRMTNGMNPSFYPSSIFTTLSTPCRYSLQLLF